MFVAGTLWFTSSNLNGALVGKPTKAVQDTNQKIVLKASMLEAS
jgi:hypothetical protein